MNYVNHDQIDLYHFCDFNKKSETLLKKMKCIYKNRLKKIINLLQKADLDEKFGKI